MKYLVKIEIKSCELSYIFNEYVIVDSRELEKIKLLNFSYDDNNENVIIRYVDNLLIFSEMNEIVRFVHSDTPLFDKDMLLQMIDDKDSK